MKRIVIALLILCVVVSISFFTTFLAENAIEQSCQALKICTEKGEDISLGVLRVNDAIRTWEHSRKILYVVMAHDDFSEIENKIIELKYLSEFPDFDEIAKISSEIVKMLDKLSEKNKVSFENIF